MPSITKLATKTTFNAKINEFKREIPSINNLATTAALTAVRNKITKLKIKLLIIVMIKILLLQNLTS